VEIFVQVPAKRAGTRSLSRNPVVAVRRGAAWWESGGTLREGRERMAYGFRPYALEQACLLPVAPREWIDDGHLVLFVHDVVSELDLSPILKEYTGGRGPKGYHPQLLLEILLYGYCTGTFSSRKLASRCENDVPYLVLTNGQRPDFRTLATFRKRHLSALQKLFVQVLRLCREAGLVQLGHLSLDGSKYQANASKHKAMSYGRIQASEPALVAEIQGLLKRASETDATEDGEYGPDRRGDELPEELRRREGRLAKIREAKARLRGAPPTRRSPRRCRRQSRQSRQPSPGRRSRATSLTPRVAS
jgi:transposase